jgi:hypothetical protein
MATVTPNYQWVVPTSSDLVKNGATAIETLGDSVDASLWNVGYGQAGKNKIINGDFGVNQRAFSTSTTNGAYTFDRFLIGIEGDGTNTASAQIFTPGAAPAAGYESINYFRWVSSGQTATTCVSQIAQRIEDVRTFAGQTVTLSFWAKAATGTPSIAVELAQNFGSGGSATVFGIGAAKTAITTSWVRYSFTIAVTSVSGKTIGANSRLSPIFWFSAGSDFNSRTASLGLQANTFEIWGLQLEAGSVATAFQTATGTIQGELAACSRYYQVLSTGTGKGAASSTTNVAMYYPFNTQMRIAPTSITFSTLTNALINPGVAIITPSTLTFNSSSTTGGIVDANVTGVVLGQPIFWYSQNIAFNAEL